MLHHVDISSENRNKYLLIYLLNCIQITVNRRHRQHYISRHAVDLFDKYHLTGINLTIFKAKYIITLNKEMIDCFNSCSYSRHKKKRHEKSNGRDYKSANKEKESEETTPLHDEKNDSPPTNRNGGAPPTFYMGEEEEDHKV